MKSSGDSTASLRDLISLLTPSEVVTLRSKLQKANRKTETHACKTATLLEELLKTPDARTAALGIAIYGHPDDKALKYLRLRLFSKILEMLGTGTAIPAAGTDLAATGIWQQLSSVQLLWHRGGYIALEAILPGIVRKAEAMECYSVLIEALRIWRRLVLLRGEGCTLVDAHLAKANQANLELQTAEAWVAHAQLDFPEMHRAIDSTAWHSLLGSQSAQVRFHCLAMRLHDLQRSGLGEEALGVSRQLPLLSRNHAVLSTPDYQAWSQCLIAHAALQSGLPKMALDALASTAFPGQASLHWKWQADLLAAEAMRLGHKSKAALDAYLRLLNATVADPSVFRQAARRHLAASAALEAGSPLAALLLLEGHIRRLNTHPDWAAASRLLEIMALIETEQIDKAELRIDALRKFLPQLVPFPALVSRYTAITKTLQRWVSKGFHGLTSAESKADSGVELSKVAGYPYPERISFWEWWQGKVRHGIGIEGVRAASGKG